MENRVITFKLQGDKINLNQMNAKSVATIIKDFISAVEKTDKNIKINNIGAGSIALTFKFYDLNIDKVIEYIKTNFFSKQQYKNITSIEIEENEKVIRSIKNDIIFDEITYNSICSLNGNVSDIGGKAPNVNIHIIIDGESIKFNIDSKETAKKWRGFLYEDVKIYAEVKKNSVGKIVEGIEIFNLEPIEELNENKINEDYKKLTKKIDLSNLTNTILDMRYKDE